MCFFFHLFLLRHVNISNVYYKIASTLLCFDYDVRTEDILTTLS